MTKEAPQALVAVITRTKNREVLLDRAVRSVHSQTMTDFVHVIINDGGDQTIVDRVLKKHRQLIKQPPYIIHNESSMGMDPAANKAIKSVRSTFVAIHDDDDSWAPTFLEKTTEFLKQNTVPAVWVATDLVKEVVAGNNVTQLSQERWMAGIQSINLYELFRFNYAPPISYLYQRKVLEELNYYDETLPAAADWDLAIRLVLRYDIPFIESKQALAYYHHRPDTSGPQGNSVTAEYDKQQAAINMVLNRRLREELKIGKLGVGYIMNALRHDAKQREELINTIHTEIADTEARMNKRFEQLEQSLAAQQTILKGMNPVVNRLRQVKRKLRGSK